MKEIEDIIKSYKQALQKGRQVALATVVHVEGSSYRRPGARMLVTDEGQLTGAISGGCLEGDALRKALLAISQQQNKLVVYNTMDEDDQQLGIQLGCNGIVYILFEPIDNTKENHPVALLENVLKQSTDSVLVTLFDIENISVTQYGTCMLFTADKKYGSINAIAIDEIELDVETVFKTQSTIFTKYFYQKNKTISAMVELIKPPVQLVIAGAGNDVFPVMEMAGMLGWKVTIVDGRKTHANSFRFPDAKKILIAKPPALLQSIIIDEQTVVVIMSHNYNYDLGMLQQLIKTNCKYIGVLGPRKKLEKMFQELEDEGMEITAPDKEKIYGPVGLDIGAETSEEIALAIIAEIKAVLSKKDAGLLKNKKGFIHDPVKIDSTKAPAKLQKSV